MVKISTDLIEHADNFINAVGDREIDLRDLRIPTIENLGAVRNQVDALNLGDNDIFLLGNFPAMPRLRALYLPNNRISMVEQDFAGPLPNLTTLILTNNHLAELGDLDPLARCSQLTHLSLIGNPVVRKKDYRLYLIYRIPSLCILDFQRIRNKEREAAKSLFVSAETGDATLLAQEYAGTVSQVPKDHAAAGATKDGAAEPVGKSTALAGLTEEERQQVISAIDSAKSMAEIQRLEALLRQGRVPGEDWNTTIAKAIAPGSSGDGEDADEEEE